MNSSLLFNQRQAETAAGAVRRSPASKTVHHVVPLRWLYTRPPIGDRQDHTLSSGDEPDRYLGRKSVGTAMGSRVAQEVVDH